jgi:cytochrome P460
MRSWRQIRIVAVAIGLLGTGLAPRLALAQAQHGKQTEAPVEATGEAKELLQKIQGYQSWPKFPEYEQAAKLSKGHGGTFVVAHYNDVAAAAVKDGASAFPDGSILVKENRPQAEAKPVALTTMAKINGSWFWLKSTPDGKVSTTKGKPVAGAVKGCIGCHSMATRDMVYSK